MNALGQFSLAPLATPSLAIERFLIAMHRAATRSFPAWMAVFEGGLADCDMDYDTRRAIVDVHPFDDYYFAAAVGLEAAYVRPLYAPDQANVLLAAIAEKVDAAAGRSDRIVSDIVFNILTKIDLNDLDSQQKPHDQVIAILLHRIGIPGAAATRALMNDLLFRHHLAEPLAVEIPKWWPAFHEKFKLAANPAEVSAEQPAHTQTACRLVPSSPRRRRALRII